MQANFIPFWFWLVQVRGLKLLWIKNETDHRFLERIPLPRFRGLKLAHLPTLQRKKKLRESHCPDLPTRLRRGVLREGIDPHPVSPKFAGEIWVDKSSSGGEFGGGVRRTEGVAPMYPRGFAAGCFARGLTPTLPPSNSQAKFGVQVIVWRRIWGRCPQDGGGCPEASLPSRVRDPSVAE
jgi:hypothetical protein